MSNSVYPTISDISLKVERSMDYDTVIHSESGGRDLALSARAQARYTWTLNYGYLPTASADLLKAFHASMGGRRDTFLFIDPLTPAASLWTFRDGVGTGTLRTTGNATWTTVYMADPYGDPVADVVTPVIRVNGVTQTLTTHYTLSTTGGAARIVFVSAPGNTLPVDWSGTYYRRCRFTNDGLKLRRIVSGIYSASVEITSQVLP